MGMEVMARYSLPLGDRPDLVRGADLLKHRAPADRVEILWYILTVPGRV